MSKCLSSSIARLNYENIQCVIDVTTTLSTAAEQCLLCLFNKVGTAVLFDEEWDDKGDNMTDKRCATIFAIAVQTVTRPYCVSLDQDRCTLSKRLKTAYLSI